MILKKNDIIRLNIISISSEGSGVGKTDEGFPVFVPASAVGDELNVRLVKVLKNYAFGRVEEILTPSPDRIESTCPVGNKCGGCVYSHISYEAELRAKEQRVADAVKRIGKIDTQVSHIVGSKEFLRYRNKAMIPFGLDKDGRVIMGFYSKHSHRIVENPDCMLQPLCFLKAAEIVRSFVEENKISVYNEQTHRGLVRHLYLRFAEKTNSLMVTLVINGSFIPFEEKLTESLTSALPQVKSIIINTNKENTNVVLGKSNRVIYGEEYITDVLCSLSFKISPHSFYQVNRAGAEKLYSLAAEYACLQGDEVLLDLYCGTGTIGLSMANRVREVIGVEIVPEAIRDAKENAKLNGIENARFICADAAKAAQELKAEGLKPHVIIIDPPRKGCDKSLINTINDFSPERVVYVSCDPATLARDLGYFKELGYITEKITPVDMFPRTSHVESVVLLCKST